MTDYVRQLREVLKSRRFAEAYGMGRKKSRRQLVSGAARVTRAKASELFRKYSRSYRHLKGFVKDGR